VIRDPLASDVVLPAAPVGPVAGAGAQHMPGDAPLSDREVELSSARPASGDALLVAYICAASEVPPRGLGEAPAQGG
jgi:hypothetical protein